jgi:hypothetical protein
VPCTTIKNLLKKYKIKNLELLKLDVEGAEIEVLKNMIKDKIFPRQVLVEYDEMQFSSLKTRKRIIECNSILIKNNYEVQAFMKPSNYLYLRNVD